MPVLNTIILTGDGNQWEEKLAGAAGILPGHLLQPTTADGVVVHSASGGAGATAVAVEDAIMGGTVDTVYDDANYVRYVFPSPGDILQMRLTAGVAYVIGDKLISGGAGALLKTTGTPLKTFGEIVEAADYTVGAAVRLGKVRIY